MDIILHAQAETQMWLSVATVTRAIEDSRVSSNSTAVHIFHGAPSLCR